MIVGQGRRTKRRDDSNHGGARRRLGAGGRAAFSFRGGLTRLCKYVHCRASLFAQLGLGPAGPHPLCGSHDNAPMESRWGEPAVSVRAGLDRFRPRGRLIVARLARKKRGANEGGGMDTAVRIIARDAAARKNSRARHVASTNPTTTGSPTRAMRTQGLSVFFFGSRTPSGRRGRLRHDVSPRRPRFFGDVAQRESMADGSKADSPGQCAGSTPAVATLVVFAQPFRSPRMWRRSMPVIGAV